MPRQIIPLNEVEETEEQEVAQNLADQATSSECIITQDEMERVLNEWTVTGKGDLIVDPTMAARLRKYIAYQEELDPLREQLAERLYMPFSCEYENPAEWKTANLYINDIKKGYKITLSSKYKSGEKTYVRIGTFKKILVSIGNPYAKYIPEDSKTRVNIVAFIESIGGEIEIDEFDFKITNV